MILEPGGGTERTGAIIGRGRVDASVVGDEN
jgi:hypothetical protein